MKNMFLFAVAVAGMLLAFAGCAGERQGLVCEEMEYRLNTMSYSPDQRAYMEEELRVCREEEAQKKAEGAAARQSIYDRFAASDSTQGKSAPGDSANADAEISVSKALQDTSGEQTTSIYDRYKGVNGADTSAAETPAVDAGTVPDTSAADAGSFQ